MAAMSEIQLFFSLTACREKQMAELYGTIEEQATLQEKAANLYDSIRTYDSHILELVQKVCDQLEAKNAGGSGTVRPTTAGKFGRKQPISINSDSASDAGNHSDGEDQDADDQDADEPDSGNKPSCRKSPKSCGKTDHPVSNGDAGHRAGSPSHSTGENGSRASQNTADVEDYIPPPEFVKGAICICGRYDDWKHPDWEEGGMVDCGSHRRCRMHKFCAGLGEDDEDPNDDWICPSCRPELDRAERRLANKSRKGASWSKFEIYCLQAVMVANGPMFHGYWVAATKMLGDRFGVFRTQNGLTNNWNRLGRELFVMDERKAENIRNHSLSTSTLPSQKKRKLEQSKAADAKNKKPKLEKDGKAPDVKKQKKASASNGTKK